MATAVQIELMVDEKGAVQGVRSFGNEVKLSATSVDKLDATLNRLNQNLDQVGQKAPQVKKIGEHALTSLDNVRLLRDDLGIRIPRSMEKAIASSKALSAAIGGIGQVLLGIGAVQIGFSLATNAIDGLKKLWDEHLSLTKAAQDYNAEVAKSRMEKFGDTDSIETTTARIDQATEAISRFHQRAVDASQPSLSFRNLLGPAGDAWQMYAERSKAHDLEGNSVDFQKQLDRLNQETQGKQWHDELVRGIDMDHARDAQLTGQRKIDAQRKETTDRAAEDRRYSVEQQRANAIDSYDEHHNLIKAAVVPADAGQKEEQQKNQIASDRAAAQTFLLRKQQNEELTRMREQALEAGLRGVALYHAQEAAAIQDLKFKDMDSVSARQAIHERFHNEEIKRLQDEQRETEKLQEQSRLAGLTGIARIQSEGAVRVNDVQREVDAGTLDPAEAEKRKAAIQQQTAAEVGRAQIEWAQRVDEVIQQSQQHSVSGFARIRADADKARADLQRQFDESHSNMDLAQPADQAVYDKDAAKLGQGMSAIQGSSDYLQAELARKNAQETLQIEQEAQRHSMSELKQQTAAITAEYQERLEKYQEQLNQQEISEDDYNRRVAAAAQERDAEMVEASKAAREKMASEFDSFFHSLDHPVQALEHLGGKVASEAAAGLVQTIQRRAGVSTADQPAQGGIPGMIGGWLGGIGSGRQHSTQTAAAAAPASTSTSPWSWLHPRHAAAMAAPVPASEQYRTPTAAEHTYSIASATIRIASANVSMEGTGSSASLFAGGGTMPQSSSSSGAMSTPSSYRSPLTGEARSLPSSSPVDEEDGSRSTPTRAIYVGSSSRPVSPAIAYTSGGGNTGAAQNGIQLSDQARAVYARSISASQPTSGYTPSISYSSTAGGGSAAVAPSSAIAGGAGASSASPVSVMAGGSEAGKPSAAGRAIGDIQQGIGLSGQVQSLLASSKSNARSVPSSETNELGDAVSSGSWASSSSTANQSGSGGVNELGDAVNGAPAAKSGGMLTGGGIAGNLSGAAGGALGLFSAYEGNGGVGGALGGALSGMKLGMALGGPIGAGIGAAAGAIVGAIGPGGREKARVYDLKTVRPKITGDTDSYQQGSLDYTTAYSDMQALDWQARIATGSMGPAAHAYYNDTIAKEIKQAENKFTQMQKAGRSMYTTSAAQFDIGADSVPRDGFAFIHQNERIMPSDQNERITRAVESQPSVTHASYVTAMQSSAARSSNGGGNRTLNMNVSAIDHRSVAQFFDQHKHHIVSALNNAKAENSGGGVAF